MRFGDGLDRRELRGRHQHARRRVAGLAGILKHVQDAFFTARSRSTSSSSRFGDLPPSS